MSVLVLGATGFIGPRLIRRLVARGETVVGMDLNPGAAAFGDVPIGAPVLRGDVTQFEDVMRIMLEVKPERVINLAYGLGAQILDEDLTALWAVTIVVSLMHFWYDAFIWSVRKNQV